MKEFKQRVKKKGSGNKIEDGVGVRVHLKGRLANGTVFENSYESERGPSEYIQGTRKTIPCIEKGLEGMRNGTEVDLVCPPNYAFGEEGKGKVPANAKVFYSAQVLEVWSKEQMEVIRR